MQSTSGCTGRRALAALAKSAMLFGLIFLAAGSCHAEVGAANKASSYGPEQPQPAVGSYLWEMNKQAAIEQRERFRKRVAIPYAVGENVQVAAFAKRQADQQAAAARAQSAISPPGTFLKNLLAAVVFLLVGIVAARKLAPYLGSYLNQHFNPWVLEPSTAATRPAKVRAEDDAFSEFILSFQAGPSATSGSAQPAVAWSGGLDPLGEFIGKAPKLVGAMQKLLQEIGRVTDDAARRKKLDDLHNELRALKSEAGLPELRPVWQLAGAVEGLVRQLAGNLGNVTASTLRTVTGGLDLLKDLCVPGLKSDLLTMPPIRPLAVDDDLITRNAVSIALKKALSRPDLAENGEAALALVAQHAYDVIFLDVEMPGIDGFELCTRIHDTVSNRATPVVFVTCHSDFEARMQSTLSGGSDLIGKPFLTFEITVKALTLALRNRLQSRTQTADARQGVSVSTATSPAPAETSQPPTGTERVAATPAGAETAGMAQQQLSTLAATAPDADAADSSRGPSPGELIHAFLARAEKNLGPLRDLIQAICQTTDEDARQELLADFYLRLDPLTPKVDFTEEHPALRMSAVLQGLVKRLLEDTRHCTSSTLFTVATAVDLLKDLCAPGVKPDLASNPPIRLLVVDDELIARRGIACALQMTFEKPESAESGEAAVALAAEKPFDVIFMDARMPGMDGFTACLRIHETAQNRTTPVVFVTNFADLKARSQADVSGGSDLMGKPFITAEITVKALSFALRGRLQKLKTGRNLM